MKKTLGIIALLIALLLAGYFATGLITEHTLKSNLKTLNQANGFSVDLVGYHRGFFSSKADVTWHMQMPQQSTQDDTGHAVVVPPKVYSFDMPLVIYHGPILFESKQIRFGLGAAHGELALPDAFSKEFEENFSAPSTRPTLKLKLFVNYLNKMRLEFELPAFQLISKQHQDHFEWLGMHSDLHFSPESTRFTGAFHLEGLRLVGEKFRVILNQLKSTCDIHKAKNALFLGNADLYLPVLQVSHQQQVEFDLKALELSSKSALRGKLFDSSFHAGFTSLLSNRKTYGPGELDVAVKNLNADVLATLNKNINQLQHASTTGGQTQQLLLSLLPELPKLFTEGAIFEITTLKLGLPEGPLDGTMHIAFPKLDASPMQIISKVAGEGRLSMPIAALKGLFIRSIKQELMLTHDETSSVTLAALDQQAVQHADQKLAHLIQVGALQTKGADYVIELKLSSGRLLVNGHPFYSGMLSF